MFRKFMRIPCLLEILAVICCVVAVIMLLPTSTAAEEKTPKTEAPAEEPRGDTAAALRARVKELEAIINEDRRLKIGDLDRIQQIQRLLVNLAPMMGDPREAWKVGAAEHASRQLVRAISYGVLLLLALAGVTGGVYGGKEAMALIKKDEAKHGKCVKTTGPEFLAFACGAIVLASLVYMPIFASYGANAVGDYMSPDLAFVEYLTDMLQDAKVLK